MKSLLLAAAAASSALLASSSTHPVAAAFVVPTTIAPSRPTPSTARRAAAAAALLDEEKAAGSDGTTDDDERRRLKGAILGRLGGGGGGRSSSSSSSSISLASTVDPVLADPLTKEPLRVTFVGPVLGGGASGSGMRLALYSSTDADRAFAGRTDTYLDLLEPSSSSSASVDDDDDDGGGATSKSPPILSSLLSLVPPPLRSIVANAVPGSSSSSHEYVPMRDLFTSPTVSFAYERGWRQGFAAAGFPGPDAEFELANEHFAKSMVGATGGGGGGDGVLVDMSCATGECLAPSLRLGGRRIYIALVPPPPFGFMSPPLDLLAHATAGVSPPPTPISYFPPVRMLYTGLFARRFAKCGKYPRVIACDYSDSMLSEARRRIRADPDVTSSSTRLDLVRCDVARIPMRSGSVDAFHAGAAMHCWPEIETSLSEVYRVLRPGGRYFATTFLSNYFSRVAGAERTANGGVDLPVNVRAFQYFPSEGYLRDLLTDAGFEGSKVSVEVLGRACVVMRCEK
ncbi:hypothetical protein ACHAW5_000871 [Stephanodiscus triporus]|uniref:Methyltransferase type 11 domain-containing protein n=1 Tax=Stephanodiscus triporus TaxID=2934178 RepID=A0ABD3PUM5_9STRA